MPSSRRPVGAGAEPGLAAPGREVGSGIAHVDRGARGGGALTSQWLHPVRRLLAADRHRNAHRLGDPAGAPAGPLPGHRPLTGHRLAAGSGTRGRPRPVEGPCHRASPDARAGPGLRHRPARRDRHPGAVGCGQRHLHGPHVHRLAVGRPRPGVGPGARRGGVQGCVRVRASDRVGSVVCPHGQPRLRQDPAVGPRDAGGADPARSTPWDRSCSTPRRPTSAPCCGAKRTWSCGWPRRSVTEPNDLEEIRFRYRRLPDEEAFEEKPHTWSKMDRS